jgi:hypothetical protein
VNRGGRRRKQGLTLVPNIGNNRTKIRNSSGSNNSKRRRRRRRRQGLILLPISAQNELFCPPHNLTKLMNVFWNCSS